MSIDGRSHGEMLLVAIGSGAIFAIIILIVLISLIRHKNKVSSDDEMKEGCVLGSPSGNFMLSKTANNANQTSPASQKSNLMFKYFGRSLSSFDTEKSYMKSDCIAINIELDNQTQIYRKHVLTPSEILSDALKDKYIQTIAV